MVGRDDDGFTIVGMGRVGGVRGRDHRWCWREVNMRGGNPDARRERERLLVLVIVSLFFRREEPLEDGARVRGHWKGCRIRPQR